MIKTDDIRIFDKDYIDEKCNIKIGKDTKLEPDVIIYDNVTIGCNSIIGAKAIIFPDVVIGDHTIIGPLTVVQGKNNIGSWTTIFAQCHVGYRLDVGSQVFIGPFFSCTNTPKLRLGKFGYPNTSNDLHIMPTIEDGVRIGGHVTLAPGVRIGKNSMISMNCFIKKDIPADSWVTSQSNIDIGNQRHD